MPKLDEAALNRQFGRQLDAQSVNAISRSAAFPVVGFLPLIWLPRLPLMQLLKHKQEVLALRVGFTNKLLRQRSEAAFGVISHQIITHMMVGIMDKYFSIGRRPLVVGPLLFEYEVDEVLVEGDLTSGVEIIVSTSIEWNRF